MERRLSISCLFAAFAALLAAAADVVKTSFPARDVVIAECVLHPSANPADDAPRLQQAIDVVGAKGGGTVFLSCGTYRFVSPVTVRRGVTVRGDYNAANPSSGTVLEITGGRGDENGTAAFSMECGAGLVGLAFYYPDQKLGAPVPYPWTVRTALDGAAGNNQTVMDCTFVNAWQALRIGPEVNECHTFRRLEICALKTGFLIDMTTDIGRITDVHISSGVWTRSGFSGSPAEDKVVAYLQANDTVAAEYKRSDWEYIRGLRVFGYKTGIRFNKAEVPTNAVIADTTVNGCTVALEFIDLNWVGVACYNSRFSGNAKTVSCGDDFGSTVIFNSCMISGGKVAVSARGRLGFSKCKMTSVLDRSSGGEIMTDGGSGIPEADCMIAPETMEWPRPVSSDVVFAEDYGVFPSSSDNTSALQKALDAAGAKPKGGTVFVPAGFYRVLGTLTIPSGVELRGSSDVPHHTQNAGTVLYATYGKGNETAKPFISLSPSSGARGIGIWYPQQHLSAPVAYPWAIRSLGTGCWLTDVNIGNAWLGIDFASNRSDGHRISYLSGGFYKVGAYIGNSRKRGWVEDIQINPHYMLRRPGGIECLDSPNTSGGEHPAYDFCRNLLRGIAFRNCEDEHIIGTFLYAAREGLVFMGRMNAQLLIHGTDTGCRGIRLSLDRGSRARVALAQLVPIGPNEEGGIVTTANNWGPSCFHATQIWPRNPVVINKGHGMVLLDQFNSCAGGIQDGTGSVVSRNGFFKR